MKLADPAVCTGCGACEKICPKQAISFMADEEGFPSPQIQPDQCVDCGLCSKVCPALHMPKTNEIQEAYAAQLLDRDALKDSTSGGLFTALSREIFRRGGVVYGCVWDENYNAVVKKAENEEEIKPMRGSKYVWSWAGDTFPEIKAYLEQGRTVLFTGLPCQVAGLKNYLGKDYDKLYLVDFFCGGVPSPLAFHAYLKTITKKVPLSKLNLLFRDKEKHGVGVHITYEGKRGRKRQSAVGNSYFYSYMIKAFHRKSCFQCQYRYEQRVEDITIGDFWKIERFHPDMAIKEGVSALLINSKKGKDLIDAIRPWLTLIPTAIENIAYWNNITLGDAKKTFEMLSFRNGLFEAVKRQGWKKAEQRYLFPKSRIKELIKYKIPKGCYEKILRIVRG